jgi:hypothetical protein
MSDTSSQSLEDALAARSSELAQRARRRQFGAEYFALEQEVLHLERAVAEQRGEPHAVEMPMGDVLSGTPLMSAVFGNAFSCAIVFPTKARQYAVLQFLLTEGYKLTGVGDETIRGHSLTGRGLDPWCAFVVKNSPWLAGLEAVDRTHPQHRPETWRKRQHYLLSFKDNMFEAIAQDVQLVGIFTTEEEALEHAWNLIRKRV